MSMIQTLLEMSFTLDMVRLLTRLPLTSSRISIDWSANPNTYGKKMMTDVGSEFHWNVE